MYCIHCGKALDPQGRFCATCGKPVNGLQPPPEPVTDFTDVDQVVKQGHAHPGVSPNEDADAVGVNQIRPCGRYRGRVTTRITSATVKLLATPAPVSPP